MTLKRLRRNWDDLGKTDPFWAILSVPEMRGNRWDLDAFLSTGKEEIANLMEDLHGLGLEPTLGRALDFGCGVGRLTQALADRFKEAWGVDIAPSMIELANRYNRHPDNCRYFLNDRPDLRLFDDGTFDLIYSNITLQHVEPTYHVAYLADFLRILEPGGLLVFQLPSTKRELDQPVSSTRGVKGRLRTLTPDPVLDMYRRTLARTEAPGLRVWGTPRDEVETVLTQHGGKVLKAEPDDWAPDWFGFRYTVIKAESSTE